MRGMAATTDTAWQAARTFDELRRHFRLSEQALADRAGTSRSHVNERRRGKTAIDSNDMDRYGRALGVPSTVFLMNAADALRFVLDNEVTLPPTDPSTTPDQGISPSGRKANRTRNRTVLPFPSAAAA